MSTKPWVQRLIGVHLGDESGKIDFRDDEIRQNKKSKEHKERKPGSGVQRSKDLEKR